MVEIRKRRRLEFGGKNGINKRWWGVNLEKRSSQGGEINDIYLEHPMNNASKNFSQIPNEDFFVKSGALVNFYKSLYYTNCNAFY